MDFLPQLDSLGAIGPLIAATFLGFITTVILSSWYLSSKHSYWKKLGVPHVRPIPLLGTVLDNFQKPQHDVQMDRYKKFGTIYGYYEGNNPALSVAEPEILRNILVKDFLSFSGRRQFNTADKILQRMLSILQGEDWKRVRTIVSPTFSTGKIKRMIGIVKDCSRTLAKNFRVAAEKGETVELRRLYGAFTMDVIASSAFSTKIDSHNDPDNMFMKTVREMSGKSQWKIALYAMFPWVVRLLRIKVVGSKGMTFFEEAAMQIIEERKKTGMKGNDFLQLLIDTAKEVSDEGKMDISEKEGDITDNYGKEENDIIIKNIVSKKSLSYDEMVAQCVIFFLAGYDTTASTLSLCSYLLALNPEAQEKLFREVDAVLKANNGDLTYEAIQSMKYLDNVISESLRIFPPGIRLERVADEDYKLGDTGITIPKGMIVTVPVYAMHRNPEIFPEPEKFDPNRWLPEERVKRNQYSYVPFGAGPRNCVAMRFALMEAKVCLAYIISNFRIKRCAKTKIPLDFAVGLPVLHSKAIDVLVEARKDATTII